jgi:hypothetical protein
MATRKSTKSQGKRARKPVANGAVEALTTNHDSATNGAVTVELQNGSASFDEVQQRAYELYLARGGIHGNDWDDWFSAESEMKLLRCGASSPGGNISDFARNRTN